ncbi:hypothetical protein L6164_033702 [Bauhinia variegata]|uniref:Uncharacterized protein n=1 Tax=Bauhinia variegata TaxID=167791 RepID=A0ACB9KSK3_BAUVA|nr:hypothetical protein L6164_033702 [Bauhinia variegata]
MKMLKSLVSKVQNGLLDLASRRAQLGDDGYNSEREAETVVPEDVREGHFAVLATKGEETKRFIVELGYLTDPAFLRLLEQAKEEFGFEQKGTLAIPCRPQELQTILENPRMDAERDI